MLTVHNTTRDRSLVDAGRVADNPWTRLRGLIGVRELPAGDGLLITPCSGVHCMFMSIPIDVLFVDKADQVVGVAERMRPWSLGKMVRRAHYVIELPAGLIAATETAVGDQLAVQQDQ